LVYHVLNRAAGRATLFRHDKDYIAFLRVMAEVLEQTPMRVCGFCLMPNHWHLVLWPQKDGDLARFMQRLTIRHARRWIEHRRRRGQGSVYQGRYKSFPMQDDDHFYTVMRYVERNPLRARRVSRSQAWRWSSLGQQHAEPNEQGVPRVPLCDWPLARPADWVTWVNRPQTLLEEESIRRSTTKGRPLGDALWIARTETMLQLPPLRPRGRPAKTEK
jgi:putative transposase